MRMTIVDEHGTVSFVAHCSAVLALTAACSSDPRTVQELLDASRRYDRGLRDAVLNGLAIFDEHNVPDDLHVIHRQLTELPACDQPAFRVLDEITREASLRSVRAGIVLFNLLAKRIVQIANTYEPITRSGEVNFHNGKFLSIRLLPYELPSNWEIVP